VCLAVVTDTAANMNLAGLLFGPDHHCCAAHALELTTGLAFDDINAMKAALFLVGHFASSTQSTSFLKGRQQSGTDEHGIAFKPKGTGKDKLSPSVHWPELPCFQKMQRFLGKSRGLRG
jgi:hypothetical protein